MTTETKSLHYQKSSAASKCDSASLCCQDNKLMLLVSSKHTQVWKCAVSVTPDKRDFTCWSLYAVGVNLNSQDQEKCAGIHFMLLVQLGKQAEIISVTPVVWMVKFIDSRNPAEAQFRVAWSDTRAVRSVQTDVRINSSKRCFFLSERTFWRSSMRSVLPSVRTTPPCGAFEMLSSNHPGVLKLYIMIHCNLFSPATKDKQLP